MLDKLKELFDKAGGYALPLKLVLGSVLGVIVGPGALGFLSELATCVFAVRHGIRPPLEGIPYLRVAVTFGSVLLTFVAAVVFFVAFRFAAGIAAQIARAINVVTSIENIVLPKGKTLFTTEDSLALIRGLSFRWACIIAGVVAAVAGGVIYLVFRYEGDPNPYLPALGGAAYAVLKMFVLWKRQAIWWFAAIVTGIGYLVAITLMFIPDYHGRFLRLVGYGGGLPVTIELGEPDAEKQSSYDTFLVLRTTEAIIVYDKADEQIREFQLSDVRSLKYAAKPLHSLEYALPTGKSPPTSGTPANKTLNRSGG